MKKYVLIFGMILGFNAYADTCPDGICKKGWQCVCDSKGLITEETNGKEKYIYTYDINGNKASQLYYEGADNINDNTPQEYRTYTYDSNFNKTSTTFYYGTDNINSDSPVPGLERRNVYDSSGRQILWTEYRGTDNIKNNIPSQQRHTSYDENSNIISDIYYDCSEEPDFCIIEFETVCAYGYIPACSSGNKMLEISNSDNSISVYKEGRLIGYKGKRIYTLEEANKVAGKVNRVSIKYK